MSKIDVLLDEAQLQQTIGKLADQLMAAFENQRSPGPGLIGIQRGGVSLASRLKEIIDARWGVSLDLGRLDITLHRDDLSAQNQPIVRESNLPFDVSGRDIILVDDVLFTGRSVRAALDAILSYGRPRRVRLLVLIDRGLRELPIQADFEGRRLKTTSQQEVRVCFKEVAGQNQVLLVNP